MNRSRLRPSPAMLIAAVALLLALTGSAIAGTGAADRALKKSKVTKIAKKQANKVLNAREAELDVKSARTATEAETAASARNADTVGGVRLAELDFSAPVGTGDAADDTTLFEGSGLKITARCAPGVELFMFAEAQADESSIFISRVDTDFDSDNPVTSDLEKRFDLGVQAPLLDEDADSGILSFEYFSPQGDAISGTVGIDEVNLAGEEPRCEAHGHVTAS